MTDTTTPSIRDSLEEVIDTVAPELAAPEPSITESAPAPEATAEALAAVTEGTQDLNALAEGQDGRERDENGRFKPKEAKPLDEGMQAGPKPGPKNPIEKAPSSWKPDAREHWAQLPDNVKAEIARREGEVQRTLQETAEARKTAEAITSVVQPYMHFIKAEGSNPIQAIDNLMATAAKLRTGTAPELAQMVAGLVNQFGIGRFGNQFIEMLDTALAGNTPRAADPQTTQVEQLLNQKLAPVQQMLTQFQQAQQMQQQRVAQQAQGEVEQFLSKAEFANDVREDMADIMEMAAKRGQPITLAEAYKKACMANDTIRGIIGKRIQAQRAQQGTQTAQQAKSKAVSVSGSAPMGAMRQDPTDIRSAIEAAISMVER